MKNAILIALFFFGVTMVPSCSDVLTKPEDPQAMYAQVNSDGSYFVPQGIGERPGGPRDTVKKDTTGNKRDTTNARRDTVKKAPPTIFADLLVKLNLTPEQKSVVEKLLAEHKACTENCLKALKAAEAEVIAKARNQESEIKAALEAGRITKAQAREKLAALKASVNKTLRELPIRLNVQECIKGCDAAFINALENILTPQQKPILKAWLEARAKRSTGGKKDTVVVNPRG